MHSENQSKVSIAKTLRLSESTVRGVLKRHLSFEPSNRYGGACNMKCNDEIHIHLKDLLKEDCTLTLKQLQASIIGKFGVKLALSTIFSNLGAINFSLKRISHIPVQQNMPNAIESRFAYVAKFDDLQAKLCPSQIIFVDEAGFQVATRCGRGWSEVNTELRILLCLQLEQKILACVPPSHQLDGSL